MYKAKGHGKDRFEVFADEMHASVLARLELEDELRKRHPQRRPRGALPAHHRSATRTAWSGSRHSSGGRTRARGLVDPGVFVPLAEELGLIGGIDSFVLHSACRQARQWREDHLGRPDLTMSVNLSARQLADPTLSDRIARRLPSAHSIRGR